MDNKPLQEFPPETGESQGEKAEQGPNLVTKWMELLAHLGLGELSLRIGTNIVIVLLVVVVVVLLESGNLGSGTVVSAASNQSSQPTQQAVI
jgi:hypothetical protein